MRIRKGHVIEDTFYPALMQVIHEIGGNAVKSVVPQVKYESVPDIIFDIEGQQWILSVKIGETSSIVKNAFIQYLRHKEESHIKFGILLMLPESIRKTLPEEDKLLLAIRQTVVSAIIDGDTIKEELRDRPFPKVIKYLLENTLIRIQKREQSHFSLPFVISMLQEQVEEMMNNIALSEDDILRIVTDRNLLMNIGSLQKNESESVGRFLASYLLMSQILFLRLLFTGHPEIFRESFVPVTPYKLRKAFERILDINYRPIYSLDVLDVIPEDFLKDTFDLIWGLEIEGIRYELPGRIFHELMPHKIRKMLAAFYTRPLAAEILSNLTINQSDESVFDPACGSGTILVSAYRRKLELSEKEGKIGNPHKRFCENEIFGSDIMPFAVHLTSANLSAMDVTTILDHTQIIQGDSLKLAPDHDYPGGLQLQMFPKTTTSLTRTGGYYKVPLTKVDSILMNPPFTKVERGIRKFVDMEIYHDRCGGEIGLWGHFIALAELFLKKSGTLGAVIPINILRGRESEGIRSILFNEWTPLYILKPTFNYGFSEWSEYRDILLIAQKKKPKPNHKVRFCLVKKNLVRLTDKEASDIAEKVKSNEYLRSDELDINSYPLPEIKKRFNNMMWFCGVTDFHYRDLIIDFNNKFKNKLNRFPDNYFHDGYTARPAGASELLFLTRHSSDSRVEKAFLRFSKENKTYVEAQSRLGISYNFERNALLPALRTPVGLSTMDITGDCDYVAFQPYKELSRVCHAVGWNYENFDWNVFWNKIQSEVSSKTTSIMTCRRMNPFSPSTCFVAFFSNHPVVPTDQMKIIAETNLRNAQAICVLLNSIIFLSQFFLLKEESTGRYIDIRNNDYYGAILFPIDESIDPLVNVFKKYNKIKYPSLREQMDIRFDERYKEFWDLMNNGQSKLWSVLDQPVQPSSDRLNFDLAVCQALGVNVSPDELIELYGVLIKEMIMIRGLQRD